MMERCRLEFEPAQLRFSEVEHRNIAGNRMRMFGPQPIREDTRYIEQLSFVRWWRGTAIGWRTLGLFGYPLGRPPVPRPRSGERST